MSSPISSNSAPTAKSSELRRRAGMSALAKLARAGALAAACFGASPVGADALNDYPTEARADYVFACMKANGETQDLLRRCSCSVDVLATIIPYENYVTAETILSMSGVVGRLGSEFRSTEPAKLAMREFRRAQAEAEVRCF